MKRNLVGVMAVSIAALLFTGCGGLSPAQKERCEWLAEKIESAEDLKKSLVIENGPDLSKWPFQQLLRSSGATDRIESSGKERAELGC